MKPPNLPYFLFSDEELIDDDLSEDNFPMPKDIHLQQRCHRSIIWRQAKEVSEIIISLLKEIGDIEDCATVLEHVITDD